MEETCGEVLGEIDEESCTFFAVEGEEGDGVGDDVAKETGGDVGELGDGLMVSYVLDKKRREIGKWNSGILAGREGGNLFLVLIVDGEEVFWFQGRKNGRRKIE